MAAAVDSWQPAVVYVELVGGSGSCGVAHLTGESAVELERVGSQMVNQGDLFPVPAPVDPHQEPAQAPFRRGSHSSWTGARAQTLPIWTEKQSALLQMLANGQPLTRNQLALFLCWPLSLVCSVLDSVRSQIEFVDYELYDWGEGRTTRRERFQIKSAAHRTP